MSEVEITAKSGHSGHEFKIVIASFPKGLSHEDGSASRGLKWGQMSTKWQETAQQSRSFRGFSGPFQQGVTP